MHQKAWFVGFQSAGPLSDFELFDDPKAISSSGILQAFPKALR
ncbi:MULTISPECIES: hypothetical protein [Streptomyces]|nr:MULTISPECIES: hypothetical protein [Streptomyces]